MHGIPSSLIINLDETGIQMIPKHTTTLAPRGSVQVPGTAKKAMAQITKVTAITASGVLLPYQLIFSGKTALVQPHNVLPSEGSFYSQTPSHFTVTSAQLEMMEKIIIPYVNNVRSLLPSSEQRQKALLIWDGHATHMHADVVQLLRNHGIYSEVLPPNCTSRYQPLDVLFNGLEKRYLVDNFSEWHHRTFMAAIERDPETLDVIPTRAAAKRSLIATLIRGVHEKMEKMTNLILTAWAKSELLPDAFIGVAGDLKSAESIDEEIIRVMSEVATPGMEVSRFQEAEELEDEELDEDVPEEDEEGEEARAGEVCDRVPLDLMQCEEEHEGDGQETDSDLFTISSDADLAPRKANAKRLRRDLDDAASVESCQMVKMVKHPDGKSIRLTYLTSSRPSPVELLEMMKAQKPALKAGKIESVSSLNENELLITLVGCDRTTFLDGSNTWTWLAQE